MEPDRLDRPLKVLTFGMVFLGIVSVLMTGYLPSPQPLLVLVILLVGFFFWKSRFHNRGYTAAWRVITVLFLAWCSYDFFVVPLNREEMFGRIPIAAMQLSIFLQIFKVYNRKTDRDYAHMFLLSFFQFVSAAGVSVELHLFFLLLVYLVVAMWALTVFHFRRRLRSPEAAVAFPTVALTGRATTGRLLTGGFFGGFFMASLLVAAIAATAFILFPRLATSDNPLNLQGVFGSLGRRFSTGSSGPIDLDIAHIIERSPAPVMTVSFPGLREPASSVLWRRGAMHQYDGKRKRWNRPLVYPHRQRQFIGRKKALVNTLIRKSPLLFVAASDVDRYHSIEDLRNDPQLIEQHYSLAVPFVLSQGLPPVFSAYTSPVAVVADLPFIACDENESFYCRAPVRGSLSYIVFSRVTPRQLSIPSPEESPEELYESVKRFYTRVPSDLSRRFESLAAAVTQDAVTDYEKAWAIRIYLANNCRYSLDITWKPGRRGLLYDFLFENKPGHCEYFASAMVILLRELGIPSRLAYGYSTGEWDPEKKVFIVRQFDAHAWAEAFIRGKGWMPFDSTPAIAADEPPQTFLSILLHPFGSFFSSCQRQWAEKVVQYDRFKQTALVSSLAKTGKALWSGAREYASSVRFALSRLWSRISRDMFLGLFLPVATVSVLLALGVAAAVRIRRRKRFRVLYRKHQLLRRSGSRVKFYDKMLRTLMDKGITKQVTDTPLEFANKLSAASRPFHGVKTLTQLYYFVRFGNGELTPEESRTVSSILRRLSGVVPPRGQSRLGG